MPGPLYIAVDLGAGSGRVFLAGLDPNELLLEEIHRFHYPPLEENGHLRWEFAHILAEVKAGLRIAGVRGRELGRTIRSIGVDTWGVDYGLLRADGELIANPVCYRDDRTKRAMEQVFDEVPCTEIFEKTGIQFQNFNTLFQLYSETAEIKKADKMLLLPDLINFFLTGNAVAEYTNATTTQMVNAVSGDWDVDLLDRLKLPSRLLPKIVPASTDIGSLKTEIADEVGLTGVRVVAPATHDTASAVAGTPLGKNWAYISSGTWSLIGVENDEVLINEQVLRHNFTNEGGAFKTVRFLKNVMGLWIFESCRREWQSNDVDVDYDTILQDVADAKGFPAFIFPDDERFLNPPSMIEAIKNQLGETGQKFDEKPSAVAKMIFDSLAFRYASVLRTIELLTGNRLEGIQILGGGGRNYYLNQMTVNASGMNANAGLTEATVVGNVLVQAITAGRFSSLAEAREHVAANFSFAEYSPRPSSELEEAAERYSLIESSFIT
ncbi:MAG TPA: rhamnulokinase family protein [Pyrinomonadaceae bacterium]|nr:rhamnulokinase family protein [Pyrinomonadaceae bacterium]